MLAEDRQTLTQPCQGLYAAGKTERPAVGRAPGDGPATRCPGKPRGRPGGPLRAGPGGRPGGRAAPTLLAALDGAAVLEVHARVRRRLRDLARELARRALPAGVDRPRLAEEAGRYLVVDPVGAGLDGGHVPLEHGRPARRKRAQRRGRLVGGLAAARALVDHEHGSVRVGE